MEQRSVGGKNSTNDKVTFYEGREDRSVAKVCGKLSHDETRRTEAVTVPGCKVMQFF